MPQSTVREFVDQSVEPNIRGFVHTPAAPSGDGIILSHGAGANARAPLLIALAETFCEVGYTVLRCDLPFRQVRPWGPPGPGDAARDRAGLRNTIESLNKILGAPPLSRRPLAGQGGDFDFAATQTPTVSPQTPRSASKQTGSLYLGGHSYGGRQSSMLCAELAEQAPELVAGLLLLSYPLHPPRKPEQQRTQHLPNLHTPTLFVHGTRDPFGSIAEIEQALKMIPAKTKLMPVEGAGHDLGFKGKARKHELPKQILSEFTGFFGISS